MLTINVEFFIFSKGGQVRKELDRKYSYDFEVYGQKSPNGENSEVEIYIAKKQR